MQKSPLLFLDPPPPLIMHILRATGILMCKKSTKTPLTYVDLLLEDRLTDVDEIYFEMIEMKFHSIYI